MKVLLTGHQGYLGTRLIPRLGAAGHEVTGLDSGLFRSSTLGDDPPPVPEIVRDIRDTVVEDLRGFGGVIHLAGLSNDPLGDIDPAVTDDINHRAAVRLARLAAEAGVRRFVFASTCSVYGSAGGCDCVETSPCRPLSAYARSKLEAEGGILAAARGGFEPVVLRLATVYGFSSRIRMDLVVNNLTAWALATGRVRLKSDGFAWRSLLPVDDVARAFAAALEAPAAAVAGRVFNVSPPGGNHRIVEVARRIEALIPGAGVEFSGEMGADPLNYRVDGSLLLAAVPAFRPQGSLDSGIAGLVEALLRWPLGVADFEGPRFRRVDHLRALLADGRVDGTFRPVGAEVPA